MNKSLCTVRVMIVIYPLMIIVQVID